MTDSLLERDLSGTYLFFSFDLVNSTAFKLADLQWPPVFNNFFDFCRLKIRDYFPQSHEWKMVGDEILFYMPVEENGQLLDAPEKVFSILQRSIRFLKDTCNTAGILSVKATLWASSVLEQRHLETETEGFNYLVKNIKQGEITLDFLGPDIDSGFRIGSFARDGKLVIGADLAALLERMYREGSHPHSKKFRIVSLEKLKGVWGGRHYPIIWYHEAWDDLENLFGYDEALTSELVAGIIGRKVPQNPNLHTIVKIYEDLQRELHIRLLSQGVELYHSNNWGNPIEHAISSERLSELQLVACCMDREKGLLIGRNRSDGLWDFGCCSLMLYRSIEESLINGYREDFGVSLEEVDAEFPPIGTYSVVSSKEKRTIPGIICLADITGQSLQIDAYKYHEVVFATLEEIQNLREDLVVPGFHRHARDAFHVYSEKTLNK